MAPDQPPPDRPGWAHHLCWTSIDKVNVIFTAAQMVTLTGDKYMLKYQADAKATQAAIDRARGA